MAIRPVLEAKEAVAQAAKMLHIMAVVEEAVALARIVQWAQTQDQAIAAQ